MIKNEKQYWMQKAAADRLRQLLELVPEPLSEDAPRRRGRPSTRNTPERREAMRKQLDELNAEIQSYEDLKNGRQMLPRLGSVKDLSSRLIQTRVLRGLTQKDLARELGVAEQQIQRYEATNYSSASLERLIAIVKILEPESGLSPLDKLIGFVSEDALSQPLDLTVARRLEAAWAPWNWFAPMPEEVRSAVLWIWGAETLKALRQRGWEYKAFGVFQPFLDEIGNLIPYQTEVLEELKKTIYVPMLLGGVSHKSQKPGLLGAFEETLRVSAWDGGDPDSEFSGRCLLYAILLIAVRSPKVVLQLNQILLRGQTPAAPAKSRREIGEALVS